MANLQTTTIQGTGYLGLPANTTNQRPAIRTFIQKFTTVGTSTWTAPAGVTQIEVLVVAGGGGGGTNGTGNDIAGGGGGGGGVVYNSNFSVTPGSNYTVTVGAGGVTAANTTPSAGGNSVFGTLTAIGGGRGGGFAGGVYYAAGSGGSGGGGTYNLNSPGTGTIGQGFSGGKGTSSAVPGCYGAGGGGGAAGPGQDTNLQGKGGDGGPGLAFSISGVTQYYAGGGGGGTGYQNQTYRLKGGGGIGGGGDGADSYNGISGKANTGGGGGGGSGGTIAGVQAYGPTYGGQGGSGIVIVRYSLDANNTIPGGYAQYNTDSGTIEIYDDVSQGWVGQDKLKNYSGHNLALYSDQFQVSTWIKEDISVIPNFAEPPVAGRNIVGNIDSYCTITEAQGHTLTNGGLTITKSASSWSTARGNIAFTKGKWYFEGTYNATWDYAHIGVLSTSSATGGYLGEFSTGWAYQQDGRVWNNNVANAPGTPPRSAIYDVCSVAVDMDAGKIWFGKNGVWFYSGNPAAGTGQAYSNLTGELTPAVSVYGNTSGVTLNFGQTPFKYDPPAGFSSVNSVMADKLVPNTVNADHSIYQSALGNTTFSVYAKAAGYNYVFLGKNNNFATDGAFFNLTNGTVSQNTSGATATINDEGDGWYRCSVTFSTAMAYSIICPSANGTSLVFTGDGTSGVLVFGAQAENAFSAGPYARTTNVKVNAPGSLGNYVTYAYTSVGISSFTPATSGNVEVLVVAGGGGGGHNAGAGGGAGGLLYQENYPVVGGRIYTVKVGDGGSGRTSDSDFTSNAGNSRFGDLVAIGGGAGGNSAQRGYDGGSGGGAAYTFLGGSGIIGQGYNGGKGDGQDGAARAGGGGGGAGATGQQTISATNGGNGGDGLYFPQFTNYGYPNGWFAGGGGGCSHYAGVTPQGGKGGGGNGGTPNYPTSGTAGVAGVANTGGGGGAGAGGGYPGGKGGSGIILVRFLAN